MIHRTDQAAEAEGTEKGPSKNELKKRAKEAEKAKKAAERSAKQAEEAARKAAAEVVSTFTFVKFSLLIYSSVRTMPQHTMARSHSTNRSRGRVAPAHK